jgi:hypothetical protein
MNGPVFCLAVLGLELPKSNRSMGKLPGLLLSDGLIIVGLGLGLVLLLAFGIFVWMKLRRKRRRHISGGEKVYRGAGHEEGDSEQDEPADDEEGADEEAVHTHHHHHGRRYKYRVRRRSHRTRNPTLSETGGLPPIKTQEPSKPC